MPDRFQSQTIASESQFNGDAENRTIDASFCDNLWTPGCLFEQVTWLPPVSAAFPSTCLLPTRSRSRERVA